MRIQLLTYNVAGLGLPTNASQQKTMVENVTTMLKVFPYQKLRETHKGMPMGCFAPDLVVVALQEMVPLNLTGLLENSPRIAEQWSRVINEVLNKKISKKDPIYIAREPITMFGLALFVFARQELNPYISTYVRDNVRTGGIGPVPLGEKGGVAVSMTVGQTTMCFVGAHLAARVGKLKERLDDWKQIEEDLSFDGGKRLADHEYVFWLGDMNSHLLVSNMQDSQLVQRALEGGDLQYLINRHDELTLERRKPPINGITSMFFGYMEGLITYPPTHPLEVGGHKYIDTPHFADRILWKRNLPEKYQGPSAQGALLLYDAVRSITLSDHRPVTAILDIDVRAPSWCPQNFPSGAAPVFGPQIPQPVPVSMPVNPLPTQVIQASIYPSLPANNVYNTNQMMTAISQVPDQSQWITPVVNARDNLTNAFMATSQSNQNAISEAKNLMELLNAIRGHDDEDDDEHHHSSNRGDWHYSSSSEDDDDHRHSHDRRAHKTTRTYKTYDGRKVTEIISKSGRHHRHDYDDFDDDHYHNERNRPQPPRFDDEYDDYYGPTYASQPAPVFEQVPVPVPVPVPVRERVPVPIREPFPVPVDRYVPVPVYEQIPVPQPYPVAVGPGPVQYGRSPYDYIGDY